MATRAALVLAASVIGMTLSAMPAVVRAEAAGDDWLPSQQHGMGFAKDPSGAVITRVTKNSAAERAGVTEGMVITHIDGLPLRELTAIQIARIFAGTGARVELKVRGNGTLIVSDAGGLRDGGSALKLGPAGE
jgi:S1-C subfamily serine protease